MPQPRISIIIPNLNQEKFLERTLCSVLDQSYDNLELIVVDGGSTDASVDIIQLYDEELHAWTSQPDDSPAAAINKGLALATGEIVGILPSDDLYLPDALELVAKTFSEEHREWIVGRCVRIDADDRSISTLDPAGPRSLAAYLMHDSGVLPITSTFLRRNMLDRVGRLDDSYKFAWHYELFARLLGGGLRPSLYSARLSQRREHKGNMSASHTLQQGMEYIRVARQHAHLLDDADREALWRNCDEREKIYVMAEAEVQGKRARRFLLNQLVRHPWWLGDEHVCSLLFHGVKRPLPENLLRDAA